MCRHSVGKLQDAGDASLGDVLSSQYAVGCTSMNQKQQHTYTTCGQCPCSSCECSICLGWHEASWQRVQQQTVMCCSAWGVLRETLTLHLWSTVQIYYVLSPSCRDCMTSRSFQDMIASAVYHVFCSLKIDSEVLHNQQGCHPRTLIHLNTAATSEGGQSAWTRAEKAAPAFLVHSWQPAHTVCVHSPWGAWPDVLV